MTYSVNDKFYVFGTVRPLGKSRAANENLANKKDSIPNFVVVFRRNERAHTKAKENDSKLKFL